MRREIQATFYLFYRYNFIFIIDTNNMKRKNYNVAGLSILLGILLMTNSCTSSSTNAPVYTGVKTNGSLSVSTITSTTGGAYAPRNVVAIWIEDNSGKFIKTLLVKAQTRMGYLTNWLSATPSANKVDAISGATTSSFGNITCSWNGTDSYGTLVSDGTYRVCMELTDKDATGNFANFTFSKGTTTDTQTPVNKPSFSNVSIVWTPQ